MLEAIVLDILTTLRSLTRDWRFWRGHLWLKGVQIWMFDRLRKTRCQARAAERHVNYLIDLVDFIAECELWDVPCSRGPSILLRIQSPKCDMIDKVACVVQAVCQQQATSDLMVFFNSRHDLPQMVETFHTALSSIISRARWPCNFISRAAHDDSRPGGVTVHVSIRSF